MSFSPETSYHSDEYDAPIVMDVLPPLRDASTSIELKAAVDAIPREEEYYTAEIRDAILQTQHLIDDAPSADAVVSFLREFTSNNFTRHLLCNTEIRDLIVDVLAPKISAGGSIENLGMAISDSIQNKSAAELFSNRKSFSAILDCFHRATTAKSACWIANSINDICLYNPAASTILNDLPVVEAYSAIIPHTTTDDSVRWVSHSLIQIFFNNETAQQMFGTPAFLEKVESMRRYVVTSEDAKTTFKNLVDTLQSIINYPTLVQSLLLASTPAELKNFVDSTPRSLIQICLVVLQKQNLIVDSPTADAVLSFFRDFSFADATRDHLRTTELRDLIVDVLAPKISEGDPVEKLGEMLCNIVLNTSAAELYSNRKSLSVILDCFPRATTATSVRWIASVINNICIYDPHCASLFCDLPVVEAYSAMIPHATMDDSIYWLSASINQIVDRNEHAKTLFGTLEFVETFRTLEKYPTSGGVANAWFNKMIDIFQSIVARYAIEESLRVVSTSSEFTAAVDEVRRHSDCCSSLIDLFLQKQHLIQDEDSTAAAVRFVSWIEQSSNDRMELFADKDINELFQNVLLPNSLKFVDVIPATHFTLFCVIINNNDEAKEFFATTSFKDYVVASLPDSDYAILDLLNALLDSNDKAQEIFGTKDFIERLQSKFCENKNSYWQARFDSVMKILTARV